MATREVFQIMLGVTPMIAFDEQEAIEGMKLVFATMKVDQKYPVVITKVAMSEEELRRIKARTPWSKWNDTGR